MYERLAFNKLQIFLDKNDILTTNQYRFRKNHSTFMAVVDMYDQISKSLSEGKFSMGIVINLSKAFDTINHQILLNKLAHLGIRSIPLQWFTSYLSERKQYVHINDYDSKLKYVTYGVPKARY